MADSFDNMQFQAFWKAWPDRRNRATAFKAFMKLKGPDREKATARAADWCAQWRKDNPQASHIHASTYLNQKRFLDADEKSEASQQNLDESMRLQAQWIKEGKHFLAKTIRTDLLREMISAGLVTPDECRRAGV